MPTNYNKKIDEALRGGMRYCFPQMGMDGRTTFPELVESEYTGEDGEGFLHFIQSILFNARKAAFRDGYITAKNPDPKDEQARVQVKVEAERAFAEFDRE